jgi:DNA-binding NarL/FixJ family response regulator
MITVALADDHPIVLDGLAQVFGLEADFEVVARCRDGEETMQVLRERRPELLVLDIRMPRLDGLAVLERARHERLPTRVLLLTAAIDDRELVEAVRLGARGLVLKELAAELVVEAARRIHAGETWFDAGLLSRLAEWGARGGVTAAGAASALTPRELEIARMVAEGLRNRAIAARLGISEGTVKLHLHHVYEKLGISGRMELLMRSQKRGL